MPPPPPPLRAAAQKRKKEPGAFHVLVDLDNVAFRQGVFDPACTAERMKAVFALASVPSMRHVESFCNTKTRDALLSRGGLGRGVSLRVSERVTKDSADHLLLARYIDIVTRPSPPPLLRILVVTHDKNLARMVRYHTPSSATHVCHFGLFGKASSSCETLDVHSAERFALSFNDRADFDAFVDSLSRFEKGIKRSR